MEHLHSYWRMAYIKDTKREEGNPFTRLPDLADKEALIVFRSDHNYIVLNRYPYNAGHLLVIPYREVPELSDLSKAEKLDHLEMIIEGKRILAEALQPHAYNVGYNFGKSAGAGIPGHLHCHIVPRWEGDTNFMPVIGDTRVLPEALEGMWERLREFVKQ